MKIAIVTGASSGMGRECVVQMSDKFAALDEIWVIARRQDRLVKLSDKVPITLRNIVGDINDTDTINQLKQLLISEKPYVKILVNAAGFGKIGEVGKLPEAYETSMIDTNCRALVNVTHIVLPYMNKNSVIMMFASAAAFLPQAGFAIYSATKSFVYFYSLALRRELKDRHIKVCAVCPGPVKTEFFSIAEEQYSIPFYKYIFMSDPKRVVAKAIRDACMGKGVSVYGITMNIIRVICKILPYQLIIKFMPYHNS